MKILKILFLLFVTPLAAYDARPPCYKQIQRDFFTYQTVGEALAQWKVPQVQWNAIIKLLNLRAAEAEGIMKKQASLLTPNPFDRPFQPDVARDLLYQVMYQIFERALLDSGFFDTASIKKMFDLVWQNDARIHQCMPT